MDANSQGHHSEDNGVNKCCISSFKPLGLCVCVCPSHQPINQSAALSIPEPRAIISRAAAADCSRELLLKLIASHS